MSCDQGVCIFSNRFLPLKFGGQPKATEMTWAVCGFPGYPSQTTDGRKPTSGTGLFIWKLLVVTLVHFLPLWLLLISTMNHHENTPLDVSIMVELRREDKSWMWEAPLMAGMGVGIVRWKGAEHWPLSFSASWLWMWLVTCLTLLQHAFSAVIGCLLSPVNWKMPTLPNVASSQGFGHSNEESNG